MPDGQKDNGPAESVALRSPRPAGAAGGRHERAPARAAEGSDGINVSKLLSTAGLVTLDPGFVNTASCSSEICYIDGDAGILRYRGYPIEQLAERSTFAEGSY